MNQDNYDTIFFDPYKSEVLVKIERKNYGPESILLKNTTVSFVDFKSYIEVILDNDIYPKDVQNSIRSWANSFSNPDNSWALKKYWYIILIIAILVCTIIGLSATVGVLNKKCSNN